MIIQIPVRTKWPSQEVVGPSGKLDFSEETGAGYIHYDNGVTIEVLPYGQSCKDLGCSCTKGELRVVHVKGKADYPQVWHRDGSHAAWAHFSNLMGGPF